MLFMSIATVTFSCSTSRYGELGLAAEYKVSLNGYKDLFDGFNH